MIGHALDQDFQSAASKVIWMPAHNSTSNLGGKWLSNGQPLSASDVIGNDLVDELAKQAAGADAFPKEHIEMVRQMAGRLHEAAMWIGRATAYANHCPVDALTAGSHTMNHGFIGDLEGGMEMARKTESKTTAR